jgi:2-polyprenyl-3-methyl-5-hydroxy-6-metoxy-1,4-benzoquinol methylase
MMTITQERELDQDVLDEFMGRFIQELAAASQVATVIIGDRLGLYHTLDAVGPCTSAELASATGTHERYVREWLRGQAAGGYVSYDSQTDEYSLTPEQSFTLAQPDSPAYIPGAFLTVAATVRAVPAITEAFTTGAGFGWHQHHPDLFEGVERFFRPGYAVNLVSSWLPSLDGVVEKLTAGARVADVGCGHGVSTILMAEAFPKSQFVGFDYHQPSIERATRQAAEAGVTGNCSFDVAGAADYPIGDYDLVAFFDCLHDMGDPIGVAKHVRETLAPDGSWMIVEPYANEAVADNFNPIGRLYYNSSTMICVPNSLSQETGAALGAQAGEQAIQDVAVTAGFHDFRRATETPFNIVYQARP